MTTTDKKFSDISDVTTINDDDVLLLSQPDVAADTFVKITVAQLKAKLGGGASPDGAAHLYWKVCMLAGSSGNVGYSLVEFHGTSGETTGVQEATGGTVLEGDTLNGYPGLNAFDADPSTFWASNGEGIGTFIGYKFPAPVTVEEIKFQLRPAGYGDNGFTLASLYYSDDGETWFEKCLLSQTGPWSDAEIRTISTLGRSGA